MLLHESPRSPADIHFRIMGIPVRVHPFFWLVAALLGLNRGPNSQGTPPEELLTWIGVAFVSILVHELGHALVQRRFGGHPWITLQGMGGMASCDDCDRSPRSQILISLAGPGAGFALAIAVALMMRIAGLHVGVQLGSDFDIVPTQLASAQRLSLGLANIYWEPPASRGASLLVYYLFFVNVFWGLVNLLPIYPLDGGRVSREICTLRDASRGIELSLRISMICAAAMAVFGAVSWNSIFVALLFGYLAYTNYQTLQAYQANRW